MTAPLAHETTGAVGRVRDPVCGMMVDPATSKGGQVEHEGVTYAFCSAGCAGKFRASPETYLTPGAPAAGGQGPAHGKHQHHAQASPPAAAAPTPGGAASGRYTCPMHPEVLRDGPGDCPICGMALEPMVVTADDGPNDELASMTRRFWVSAALAVRCS